MKDSMQLCDEVRETAYSIKFVLSEASPDRPSGKLASLFVSVFAPLVLFRG